MFSGIQKLAPGHTLVLDRTGQWSINQYWELGQNAQTGSPEHPESFYINGYRDLLRDAVQSHLMADVPLGVFLSGGIDSSAIAALMTDIRRSPIEPFPVGYSKPAYSALPYSPLISMRPVSLHPHTQLT